MEMNFFKDFDLIKVLTGKVRCWTYPGNQTTLACGSLTVGAAM